VKNCACYDPVALILKYMLNYQQEPLDLVFQALADPTRRGMIARLSRGPASVSELAQPFDMSLPAVVQHLQVLESSGLVTSEKVGRVRTCRIEPKAMMSAEDWISGQRASWEARFDRLGEYLNELQAKEKKRGRKR
jgi:DNA-binding transcriptional ArsR family regulator